MLKCILYKYIGLLGKHTQKKKIWALLAGMQKGIQKGMAMYLAAQEPPKP